MSPTTSDYPFATDERPGFPGAPFVPRHTRPRRIAYGLAGVLIGLCTTFPNGLISANLSTLPGSLGEYTAAASCLPAIYVAMNASANLTLVKARIQFGIPTVTAALLGLYALVAVIQLCHPSLSTAIASRVVNGVTAGALITLCVYYLLQVFPVKMRPLALVIGVGLTQFGAPLARTVPVDFLAADHWRGLHLTELVIALVLITVTLAVPLPPSERQPAFKWRDLLTIALATPACLMFSLVLGLGRILWWTDTPWLGVVLAVSIGLFAIVLVLELSRPDPMLRFEWFGSLDLLRFAAVALFVRLALAEQTFGSVGLLTAGGLTDDQLRGLFAWVSLSMLAGLATAVLTLSERRLPGQVMAAAALIALGAFLDSGSNTLTRPTQLLLSQCLLGFGATLFIGPALVYGFLRMSQRGAGFFVTFVVLFSTTQNIGGLVGSALLGSLQTVEARLHATDLSEHVLTTDPAVGARIAAGAAAVGGGVADPALRTAEGANQLSQALGHEASILAFDDIFRLVAIFAAGVILYVSYLLILRALQGRLDRMAKASA